MKQRIRKPDRTEGSSARPVSAARSLAPEDIRPDQYVAVTHVVAQFLWPFSCDGADWRLPEVRKVLWMPYTQRGPLKIVEVCLPFVLARQVDGKHRVLDTRTCRLAKLSERFGRRVFRRLKDKDKDKDKASLDSDMLW